MRLQAGICLSLLFGFLLSSVYVTAAGPDLTALRTGRPLFRTSEGIPLDAPYIVTHNQVVDQMLALAGLKEGDVLYDLGCGDGRIVIEAVKRAGVLGVGVDLDPARIAESRARARAAGVADKISFLQQDLFDSDIRKATVVALYLGSEVNMRLRPKLFSSLRPGTRIISHLFGMGDWKADKEVSLWLWDDGLHDLYLWIVPANVSGVWTGKCGKGLCRLGIDQRLQRIKGSLFIEQASAFSLTPTAIQGDTVRFTALSMEDGQKRTVRFDGKVRNNVMEGVLRETGTPDRSWRATRNPATVSWIE